MKKITKDFTSGSIAKQLWWFMLPFMASNAMQVLYSTIDMIIVGRSYLYGVVLGYASAPYGYAIPGMCYFLSGKWVARKNLAEEM